MSVDLGNTIKELIDAINAALSAGNSYVTINTEQNITGKKTFKAPSNASRQEQVTAWFETANGGRIGFGKEAANSGTGIFFDQVKGTRRLNFRASATAGAMVWEQPEQGAQLYIDLGKKNADYHRVTFPSQAGTLALTSQIPTITVGGEVVNNISFTSNPQTQIDNLNTLIGDVNTELTTLDTGTGV